jgi:hypothetical protein
MSKPTDYHQRDNGSKDPPEQPAKQTDLNLPE